MRAAMSSFKLWTLVLPILLLCGILYLGSVTAESIDSTPPPTSPPGTETPETSSPPIDLKTERDAAMALVHAGEVTAGAQALCDSLRSIPLDAPTYLDEGTGTLQALAFVMAALMKDDELEEFLTRTLDTIRYPIDELIRLHFDREFDDYAAGRSVTAPDEVSFRERVMQAAQSSEPVVRVGALALLANPEPEPVIAPGAAEVADAIDALGVECADCQVASPEQETLSASDFNEIVDAINALAVECADCQVTREALYGLISDSAGPQFQEPEAVQETVFSEPIWNAEVQALIATDPVAQLAQAAIAQATETPTTGDDGSATYVEALSDAALSDADPRVRDWATRSLATTEDLREENLEAVATPLETDVTEGSIQGEEIPPAVAVDVARAQLTLFTAAIDDRNVDEAEVLLPAIMTQNREQEPFDVNLFEATSRTVAMYAQTLVDTGHIEDAIAVFRDASGVYPNSRLASECQRQMDELTFINRTQAEQATTH